MNTALEKLLFRVQVVDKASKPISAISKQIDFMKATADKGFSMIRNGASGAVATGAAIYGMVNPIRQVNKALGEVRSLDVTNKELQKLEKTAYKFQNQYGESAAEFIRSSYDIQSSISGLVNGELAEFTMASNLLAKGTKSDAATITNYMGTMYGIFKDNADKMGKSQWVRQLTGQTAAAVQMFKTTGSEMASSFSNLGSSASTMGVGMEEQLAILGHLQSTMSGSEAATKYRAFLNGAGNAQKALNIRMTDTTGKLLPMHEILGKLHDRFGDTFTLAESDALKKAFGSDEAVTLVKNLIKNSSELEMSIHKISKIKGLGPVEKMAADMTDTFDRLWGSVKTGTAIFGKLLLPVLNPIVDWLGRVVNGVQTWLEKNPRLAKLIGIVTLSIMGLAFAFSVLTAAVGVGYLAFAAFLKLKIFLVWLKSGIFLVKIFTAVTWLWNAAIVALTSPFLWIPLAIAAVVGAIWYLWKNWDKIFGYLNKSSWGKALIVVFKLSLIPLKLMIAQIKILWSILKFLANFIIGTVVAVFKKLWEWNVKFYTTLWKAFTNTSIGQGFLKMLEGIKYVWGVVVDGFESGINWIGKLFDDLSLWAKKAYNTIATIVDKLKIEALTLQLAIDDSAYGEIEKVYRGIEARNNEIRLLERQQKRATAPKVAVVQAQPMKDPSKKIDVPAGGYKQEITDNSKSTSVQIGSITTSEGIDRGWLEELMWMQGG